MQQPAINIRTEKTYLHCAELFIAKTTVTRYCSHACSSRAYKKRKRQEKIQQCGESIDNPSTRQTIYNKAFLSMQEACELLGTSRWTLYRMIKQNELNTARLGKRVIIRRSDLESLFTS